MKKFIKIHCMKHNECNKCRVNKWYQDDTPIADWEYKDTDPKLVKNGEWVAGNLDNRDDWNNIRKIYQQNDYEAWKDFPESIPSGGLSHGICPEHLEEIRKEILTVTEDVKIILDGKIFLLERGDKIWVV